MIRENGIEIEHSEKANLWKCALISCVFSDGATGPRLNNNQLYKFSYTTEVLLDSTRGPKENPAGYRISSHVDAYLVWRDPSSKDDQLIQLAVRPPHRERMWCHFLLAKIKESHQLSQKVFTVSFPAVSQISNVKLEPATPRAEKSNILHGATAESVLGKTSLAALTKPFLLHLRNGKVMLLNAPIAVILSNGEVSSGTDWKLLFWKSGLSEWWLTGFSALINVRRKTKKHQCKLIWLWQSDDVGSRNNRQDVRARVCVCLCKGQRVQRVSGWTNSSVNNAHPCEISVISASYRGIITAHCSVTDTWYQRSTSKADWFISSLFQSRIGWHRFIAA